MKTAYAMSWAGFMATMQRLKLDDSNIEEKYMAGIIEIMGEQDLQYMPFRFQRDHPNVLRLVFDDVDTDMKVHSIGHPDDDDKEYFEVKTMSKEQGEKIVKFINDNELSTNFVIHCAAGISRSGSVAKFIIEYFGGTDKEFHLLNPHCSPKAGFLKTLRDAAQDYSRAEPKVDPGVLQT